MIVEYTTTQNSTTIRKFWRDSATHERNMEVVTDYTPYFFIKSQEEQVNHTLGGVPVEKKFANHPWDIKEIKDLYENYESDIQHTQRYMLDKMELPLPNDYLRTLYIDIETYTHAGEPFPDQETAPHRICLICAYDNLTEQYYTFDDDDEYELLTKFAAFVRDADPDVMTAWNSDFDFATIYNRMTQNFMNPKTLSGLNYVTYDPRFGVRIAGMDTLDLLFLYKRLHFGELDSFALNSVGAHELGLTKIDTGSELPGDMLDSGKKQELEDYCLRDVEIMVKLDQKMKIIEFHHLLQRLSGLPNITAATSNSRIHDALILRKAHARNLILPSKEMQEKVTVVGGRVLDPIKGIHEDVAVLDIVGMYVNIFKTLNVGYETVSRYPRGNSVKVETDTGTLYIDQDKKSLWVEVLDDLMEERAKYKNAMKESHVGSDEYEFNHQNQFALKTLIASAYGVSNFRNFRLYSHDVSNIITFMGREMNKHMENVVNNEGYSCVYGDTDSIFVKGVKDAQNALELETIVNDSWDGMLATMGIDVSSMNMEIEFDAFYDRIFFTDVKKKYVGHYTFKNGEDADGVKIAGFQTKRSDSAKATKILQEDVINIILTSPIPDVEKNVTSRVKETLDTIKTMDYLDIGIPKGLKKDPRNYGIQNLYTKAVIYSQDNLGMGNINVVKPLIFSVKRVKPDSNFPDTKSIAVDPSDANQLQVVKDNFDLDWDKIEEKVVENPMEKILDVFGINLSGIKSGNKQSSLFSF